MSTASTSDKPNMVVDISLPEAKQRLIHKRAVRLNELFTKVSFHEEECERLMIEIREHLDWIERLNKK